MRYTIKQHGDYYLKTDAFGYSALVNHPDDPLPKISCPYSQETWDNNYVLFSYHTSRFLWDEDGDKIENIYETSKKIELKDYYFNYENRLFKIVLEGCSILKGLRLFSFMMECKFKIEDCYLTTHFELLYSFSEDSLKRRVGTDIIIHNTDRKYSVVSYSDIFHILINSEKYKITEIEYNSVKSKKYKTIQRDYEGDHNIFH